MQVGRDSRPVMREAYNMFKDGGDPEKVRIDAFLSLELFKFSCEVCWELEINFIWLSFL